MSERGKYINQGERVRGMIKRNQAQQSVQITTERSWAFTSGEKK